MFTSASTKKAQVQHMIDAIAAKNESAVRLLLARGYDIHAKDKQGYTAIQNAAQHDSLPICEMLISHGADVHGVDPNGYQPLSLAASAGHLGVCKLLLAKGANAAATAHFEGTALHWAAYQNQADICTLLLDAGVPIDVRDNSGETPLHHAAQDGAAGACELLLSRGADAQAENAVGQTPLHAAAKNGYHVDVCQLLVNAGANSSYTPEAPDHTTYLTPVQLAVKSNALDIALYFFRECDEDPAQVTMDEIPLVELAPTPEMRQLVLSQLTELAINAPFEGIGQPTPKSRGGMAPL